MTPVRWSREEPPRIPSDPGYWWLDGEPVRVEIDGHHHLVVVRRNGKRKPVHDFEGWAGPCIRDPRVPTPDELEDIPF